MKKVLVLGSGGLQIGQAGEFDYSGSQAIKSLKEEGIKVILINPNIATVQTDPTMADVTYLQPLNIQTVTKIIEKEEPEGVLLSFGGQTALNLGLSLYDNQVLAKYNVSVLGTGIESIRKTEDRALFKQTLQKIGVKTPHSICCHNMEEVREAAEKITFPIMIRSGYSLGGLGAQMIGTKEELLCKAQQALFSSSQILVEEYLFGWKEIEYEIVRDKFGNSLAICNMENLDPMGIHTGESIVIAPSQTLNDYEYQKLRTISLQIANELNIIGECNVQIALCPKTSNYRVIEVNARLSRSSALASKATGYPLAFVAAKLGLNKALYEIPNSINQTTTAFFEPALDYLVVKIPRWDMDKFPEVDPQIGAEMKSVGEVMGIGRSFGEAMQKAIRMLNIGAQGLSHFRLKKGTNLVEQMQHPTSERIFVIYQSLLAQCDLETIYEATQIDRWFLHQLKEISDVELELRKKPPISPNILLEAKKAGFSDLTISHFYSSTESSVRQLRKHLSVLPSVKQIDGFAGEFPAKTNYLYLTYHGSVHDVTHPEKKAIAVLGSGPYCIGSSVEFDWCAVNTLRFIKKSQFQSILINSNPETVSTDYDESSRLYFEELSFERVADILDFEQPEGVIVSMGGQIANTIALELEDARYPIMGTSAKNIDRAENRAKFSSLLNDLGIDQPDWIQATSLEKVKKFICQVKYPVIIRPSYVLSGKSMRVFSNEKDLLEFFKFESQPSQKYPVVISKFIEEAKELEVDGVSQQGVVKAMLISEHVEYAGIHSGDATHIFPAQNISNDLKEKIRLVTKSICENLQITGPFNIQLMVDKKTIQVIECNLRASRSFPFVSKTSGYNLIEASVEAFLNKQVKPYEDSAPLNFLGVKSPQFSFNRLKNVDPTLGVEMQSTGEVAVLAENLEEAFYNSWVASGQHISSKKILIHADSPKGLIFNTLLVKLIEDDWQIYTTKIAHEWLGKKQIQTELYPENLDSEKLITIGLLIDTSSPSPSERATHFSLRKKAVSYSIPIISNTELADLMLRSLVYKGKKNFSIKSLQEFQEDSLLNLLT